MCLIFSETLHVWNRRSVSIGCGRSIMVCGVWLYRDSKKYVMYRLELTLIWGKPLRQKVHNNPKVLTLQSVLIVTALRLEATSGTMCSASGHPQLR